MKARLVYQGGPMDGADEVEEVDAWDGPAEYKYFWVRVDGVVIAVGASGPYSYAPAGAHTYRCASHRTLDGAFIYNYEGEKKETGLIK